MKLAKSSALLLAISLTSGCAINEFNEHYYTFEPPTLESVSNGVSEGQLYKQTYFTREDFHEDGRPRTAADYDFLKESAPCTVLEWYQGDLTYGQQFFVVEGATPEGPVELLFECRDRGASPSWKYKERRLFLVGSAVDCGSRTWDYSLSEFRYFRTLDSLCDVPAPTSMNQLSDRLSRKKVIGSHFSSR